MLWAQGLPAATLSVLASEVVLVLSRNAEGGLF